MKKLFPALVLMVCISTTTSAQITFQKTIDPGGANTAYAVQQTPDGGYIIAGDGYGFGDVYLTKTDADGDTVWTKMLGGTSPDNCYSVDQTNDGGYILAGSTQSFGEGSFDVYLIKTDADGNSQWAKTYGTTNPEVGSSVQQTSDNGYIITGNQSVGNATFVYLVKTDVNGDLLWSKAYGGWGPAMGRSVKQTGDGGYIVGGLIYNPSGNSDVYLIKTDAVGDTVWTKAYGGANTDIGSSVEQTTDGGYIVTGTTGSFNVLATDEVYLIKTDASGDTLWTRTYGGTDNDWGHSVKQTADGGYIVVGTAQSFSNDGNGSVYLIRADADGDTLWTKIYGDVLYEEGYSVEQTADGGYIVAGNTQSFGVGFQALYLIKTDASGNTGCNESGTNTIVSSPTTLITYDLASVLSPNTIQHSGATTEGFGGIVTSLCTTVGDNEIPEEGLFVVSPNPASGKINIRSGIKSKQAELKIFNSFGQQIFAKQFISNTETIDISHFAEGIYFVKITDSAIMFTGKIVVQ